MIKTFYCGLATLGILLLLSFQLPENDLKRFYVALNGKDSNKGTIDKPFATLEAAQTAVRETIKNGNITSSANFILPNLFGCKSGFPSGSGGLNPFSG